MVVTNRFSRKASEFRALGKQLLSRTSADTLRQAIRTLQVAPIIEIDDYPEKAYLLLSPDRVLTAVCRFLIDDSVAHLGKRFGRNASGERGQAFERYLQTCCPYR
jgi:hypothetical protein